MIRLADGQKVGSAIATLTSPYDQVVGESHWLILAGR
jgi:hypothetical protein